jgi:pimeloyl-ACP methyl ester carboxylesterase
MYEILYLHGFGETEPNRCRVARAIQNAAAGKIVHSPCYHPGGHISATRIGKSLEELATIIEGLPGGRAHLGGYSFGGLLAALLAERRPELVANVLLLAPAIDNYARNFAGCDPGDWYMPQEYVEELRTYPPRPAIVRPTILVHGELDVDRAGSAPWRVREWASKERFQSVHFLDGVDHGLEPWLSSKDWNSSSSNSSAPFRQVIREFLAETSPT